MYTAISIYFCFYIIEIILFSFITSLFFYFHFFKVEFIYFRDGDRERVRARVCVGGGRGKETGREFRLPAEPEEGSIPQP